MTTRWADGLIALGVYCVSYYVVGEPPEVAMLGAAIFLILQRARI